MEDKYAWQDTLYQKWRNAGMRGLVKGTVSCGKTRGGAKCIDAYLSEFGEEEEVWVLAPTHEILEQWGKEPLLKEKYNITYYTYLTAVSRLTQRKNEGKKLPDLLVMDEAHTATAPVTSKIFTFNIPFILGLTATPNGVEHILPIFEEIKWESANIAPTTIHYVHFTPTSEEMKAYDKKTKTIEKYEEDHFPGYTKGQLWAMKSRDQIYSMFFIQRRNIAYKMRTRQEIALKLITEEPDRRTMMFFERKAQVYEFAKELDKLGISYCVHVTGDEHLDEYVDEMTNIVLCVKKLKAGFNSPTTTRGIVVSTALGKANHVQTIGRILRPLEGKHADVYVLLAEGTTDTMLYSERNQMFPPEMTEKNIYSNGCILKI